MPRSRRCAKSGTGRPIDPFGQRFFPIRRRRPAPIAACVGACEDGRDPLASMARPAASVRNMIVSAVIPCLEEEAAIGRLVRAVLADNIAEVVVVDGGSRDRTAEIATAAGAKVIVEHARGYGRAIQAGIAAARRDAEVLLFLDGDGSDDPVFIPTLIAPIAAGETVFVHGS